MFLQALSNDQIHKLTHHFATNFTKVLHMPFSYVSLIVSFSLVMFGRVIFSAYNYVQKMHA